MINRRIKDFNLVGKRPGVSALSSPLRSRGGSSAHSIRDNGNSSKIPSLTGRDISHRKDRPVRPEPEHGPSTSE